MRLPSVSGGGAGRRFALTRARPLFSWLLRSALPEGPDRQPSGLTDSAAGTALTSGAARC